MKAVHLVHLAEDKGTVGVISRQFHSPSSWAEAWVWRSVSVNYLKSFIWKM